MSFRKYIYCFVFFLFSFRLLSTFAKPAYPFYSQNSKNYADSVMATLSIDDRIGQLFMVYAETDWDEANLRSFYKDWDRATPGGIILFRGGPKTVKAFINKSQRKVKVPLLMSVDGEFGLSMRMDSFPSIPYNMVLGAVRDSRIVVEAGDFVGKQCRQMGIHINFAPVIDLNNNPDNPVINFRSFGEETQNVVDKGYAYLYGLQRNGVLGVGKHFPGHGNTGTDSHHALPVIQGDYSELYTTELKPFELLASRGLDAVMVGHLDIPGLDNSGLPATLSKKIVSDVLKDSLGFGGLIITDGMNMGAVARGFDQPFVKSIQAGNDILLLPASYPKAFREVQNAVLNGSLDTALINDRCSRILMAKYNLIGNFKTDTLPCEIVSAEPLNDKIYRNAVTLLKNENNLIPFKRLAAQRVALVENVKRSNVFRETVQFYNNVDVFYLDSSSPDDGLLSKLKAYDQVLFSLHGSISKRKTNYGISDYQLNTVENIAKQISSSIVLLANPYALRNLSVDGYKALNSVIVGYSNDIESQKYSAQILFGGSAAVGKLSISAMPHAMAGEGLFSNKIGIGFNHLQNSKLSPVFADSLEYIVKKAIKDQAIPGCQILVAKDGDILFQKSYGYHTYKKEIAVKNTDLYDLASVSKIVATLPILMQMNEAGDIHLNQTLGDYLPRIGETNKADISIRDVLRHTAGLAPHIAFQFALVNPKTVSKYGLINNRKSRVFAYRIDQSLYINKYLKYYPSLFKKKPTMQYPLHVADEMYASISVLDSIRTRIDSSKVTLGNTYKYSDLGYYYLKEIIEKNEHAGLGQLAQTLFYKPLGMHYTTFNPLQKYSKKEIIPTEKDTYFRKQLLDGYVHDQGAALMGGVAGHAGLFSNAGDLSKMMQMYLNGGSYGGEKFFDWNTMHYFSTDTKGDGRRAIGFDKPEPDTTKVGPTCHLASLSSYGHSGFTGTYVWVDPDYQLIYIFLSNRVHPDAFNQKLLEENIRTRIQEQIYRAIL